jgi:hypothetical protein
MLYLIVKRIRGKKKRGFKMIKVFIPENKRKYGKKELARGFWQSASGRVYYDYLNVKDFNLSIADNYGKNRFLDYLESLKISLKQEAIFYKIDNVGYCYYSREKIEILPSRIYKEVSRENLKKAIQEALRDYKGVTIYSEAGRYYIEIFKTI